MEAVFVLSCHWMKDVLIKINVFKFKLKSLADKKAILWCFQFFFFFKSRDA